MHKLASHGGDILLIIDIVQTAHNNSLLFV